MFSRLSDKLQDVFKDLRGHGRISESNVNDALREVRMALLEADVHFKVAKDFIARVKDKALGEEVLRSVTPGQQIVKIFHDELATLLGSDAAPLQLGPQARILVVGLNGAGKTTTCAKLAAWLKKNGRKPVLVACDLQRPAAIEQLATLAEQIGVPVYRPAPGEKDVLRAVREGMDWAKSQGHNVEIYDTAGRQDLDDDLIGELRRVKDLVQPDESLLVCDAATGQQAVGVAEKFHGAVGVTGLILTKLDGDARGGAALSLREVTGQPVKFAGTGEKVDAFEVFHPDRMAGRILGMGDVVSLVEKAAENFRVEDAARMEERLRGGNFDLNDFLDQFKAIRRMGPLENLLGLLPGMDKLKGSGVDEKQMRRVEAIVLSMTPGERARPELLNARRRQRIARGSGTTVTEVNSLLLRFSDMKKLMKSPGKLKKMMARAGAMGMLGRN
ncbi:MAG: signal recognition particle protein [Chthoniobacterales bacterium]|nr:signal recognition particle protein [Chthoniobacterales bacterium]